MLMSGVVILPQTWQSDSSTQMLFLILDPDLYSAKMFSRNYKSSVDNCQNKKSNITFCIRAWTNVQTQASKNGHQSLKALHCAFSVCICNSSIATIVALVIFGNCYKNNNTTKNPTVLLILLVQHETLEG